MDEQLENARRMYELREKIFMSTETAGPSETKTLWNDFIDAEKTVVEASSKAHLTECHRKLLSLNAFYERKINDLKKEWEREATRLQQKLMQERLDREISEWYHYGTDKKPDFSSWSNDMLFYVMENNSDLSAACRTEINCRMQRM